MVIRSWWWTTGEGCGDRVDRHMERGELVQHGRGANRMARAPYSVMLNAFAAVLNAAVRRVAGLEAIGGQAAL
jgi:hypothetical protein